MFAAGDYTGVYIVAALFGLLAYFIIIYLVVRLAVAHVLAKRAARTNHQG